MAAKETSGLCVSKKLKASSLVIINLVFAILNLIHILSSHCSDTKDLNLNKLQLLRKDLLFT